ncbi:radical SAM protein [Actinomyces vulturis]|uniref:radical SAM protein n=1 Tax=Actinomyces vulturis TaxID=1857645 RepID=UPI00082EE560|nr:radical SAM protein [Actinomyces vulturis]
MNTWDNIERLVSSEGNVEKFVFSTDNAVAESVLYRYPTYDVRTVICCSTQSGCPVGCRFCGAGDNFARNLTTEEIVSQSVYLLDLIEKEHGVTDIENLQIMFMSMGEPMLNQKRLVEAIEQLHEKYPHAALLVSTSGPNVSYDAFFDVAQRIDTVGLQFSVHESTDQARDELIPFKRKLTLEQIAQRGERFHELTSRPPFFNYCVHEGNDTAEDVKRLAKLFNPDIWRATISVICERDETMKAAHDRQRELTSAFSAKMDEAGFTTRVFNPAGQDDIGGGCGQLHYVQEWMRNNPDKVRPSVGHNLPIIHAS